MKIYLNILVITAFASAQAEVDWSKVTPIYTRFEADLLSNPDLLSNLSSNPLLRIVGGNESIPNSRPYQAGLLLPVAQGTSFCGGSLITRQTVLTAAHCVDQLVGPVEVILGAHNIQQQNETTQRRFQSSRVIIHPQWNRTSIQNDVALIILPQSVTLNANIQLVRLPQRWSNADYVNEDAIVSGWGRASDSSNSISPVLREATVQIITNSQCNIRFLGSIIDSHICASGQWGRSGCNGDSGGALVVNGVQVGVVSFVIALGCEVGWPSVYARVTSYNDWIQTNQV